MESLKPKYVIAGCGPGSKLLLTRAVEQAVAEAKVLAGAARLLGLFRASNATQVLFEGSTESWLTKLAAEPDGPVVVLVSGDPGVSSLATCVLRRFGRPNCRLLPGISSVQVACSRLGLSWDNAVIINAHSSLPEPALTQWAVRDPWVILMGARGAEVFVSKLAESVQRGCFVCEDLSLETERVERFTSQRLARLSPHPRRIVVLTREFANEA